MYGGNDSFCWIAYYGNAVAKIFWQKFCWPMFCFLACFKPEVLGLGDAYACCSMCCFWGRPAFKINIVIIDRPQQLTILSFYSMQAFVFIYQHIWNRQNYWHWFSKLRLILLTQTFRKKSYIYIVDSNILCLLCWLVGSWPKSIHHHN